MTDSNVELDSRDTMDLEAGLPPLQSEEQGIRKRQVTFRKLSSERSSSSGPLSAGHRPQIHPPPPQRGLQRQPSVYFLSKGKSDSFVKRSRHPYIDVETGEESVRECRVHEVTDFQEPMSPKKRLLRRFLSMINGEDEEEKEDEASAARPKQYRLSASRNKPYGTLLQRLSGLGQEYDDLEGQRRSHASLTAYLHWTLRTSYMLLLLSSAITFWGMTIAWAIGIQIVGHFQPECILMANDAIYDNNFIDAYSLSWTTFSTVGYGNIYPDMSRNTGPTCVAMSILMTLESFFGVLFAGFMCAIVFGKITRTQSFATATFSDPIVVRYGTGVDDRCDDANSVSSESSEGSTNDPLLRTTPILCPILEFRLVNRMHGAAGGEIMNANIHCVASILASDASESLRESLQHRSAKKHSVLFSSPRFLSLPGDQINKLAGLVKHTLAGSFQPMIGEDESFDPDDVRQNSRQVSNGSIIRAPNMNQVMDEDPSGTLMPCRIFSSLNVETPSHPFFKRIWNIRHVLDADSPLLSSQAKRRITENNGFWPEDWNNYQSVRENIHFHQIIVNLSGTANASGRTVYAQKVYEFCDINVGYSFANTLCRDSNGRLSVDMHLINDVVEQYGGGGEPFTDVVESDVFGAAVDATGAALGKAGVATGAAWSKAGQAAGVATDVALDITGQATAGAAQGVTAASGALDKAGQVTKKTVGMTCGVAGAFGNAAGATMDKASNSFSQKSTSFSQPSNSFSQSRRTTDKV